MNTKTKQNKYQILLKFFCILAGQLINLAGDGFLSINNNIKMRKSKFQKQLKVESATQSLVANFLCVVGFIVMTAIANFTINYSTTRFSYAVEAQNNTSGKKHDENENIAGEKKQIQKNDKKDVNKTSDIEKKAVEEKKIIRESTENNKTQNNQTLQVDTTFYDVYSGFKKEDLMDSQIGDRVLGCSKAPHTIIEYSSFSCPHCADYHESVWPRVKAELIDTCKVRYIYRDFPTTGSSAFASLVAYCLTQNDTGAENYYKLLDTFFISQRSWVFSGDYQDKILQIIKLNGFAEKQFNVCTENKNMANMILARAFVSQDKLNINYTPTIFIDGEKIDDMLDFASISKALNSDKKTNK